ncbi:MAG: AbrB/MazE/SpoVT family DNA-binding domain-containing protein [Victivallales bacterium]|nr:AbrB/MazE/SpoVT family DNA-binding domain-containing protein [Victivallales bacterium]
MTLDFNMETAKVFMTGRSQAVRIPKKYRFDTPEVQIQKKGNKIILSPIDRKKLLEKFLSEPAFPDFDVHREELQDLRDREWFQ